MIAKNSRFFVQLAGSLFEDVGDNKPALHQTQRVVEPPAKKGPVYGVAR